MKTEQEITAQHQSNVEQEAVFLPKRPDTDVIEIDENDPVIFPGVDKSEALEDDSDTEKSAEYRRTEKVIRGFAKQAVVAKEFIEGDLQRKTELMANHLPKSEQIELIEVAYDTLKDTPRDEVAHELVKENRQVAEVAHNLSTENKMLRQDIELIESILSNQKAELLTEAAQLAQLLPEDSDELVQIRIRVDQINRVLKRHRKTVDSVDYSLPATPKTDELERLMSLPSAEKEETIPEKIIIPEVAVNPTNESLIRRLAKKVVGSTVQLVGK